MSIFFSPLQAEEILSDADSDFDELQDMINQVNLHESQLQLQIAQMNLAWDQSEILPDHLEAWIDSEIVLIRPETPSPQYAPKQVETDSYNDNIRRLRRLTRDFIQKDQ